MTEKPSVSGEARKKRREALHAENRRYWPATGLCRVRGNRVMVIANDSLVKAGVYCPINTKKHLRVQNIAEEAGIPCVYIKDSPSTFLHGGDIVPGRHCAFQGKPQFFAAALEISILKPIP